MVLFQLGSILTIVLLLLGYREVRLRIGRLADRIVLVADESRIVEFHSGLVTVTLIQTLLFPALGYFQLVNSELRAASFYLLLVKAALLRWPPGLTDGLSIAATAWLAFSHLWSGRRVVPMTAESGGILATTEELLTKIRNLILQDRLEIWLAASAVIYLLGFLFLIGWLLARAVFTAINYFTAGRYRYVCYAFCAGFLIMQAGRHESPVRNVALQSSMNTTNNHDDKNESLAAPAASPLRQTAALPPVGEATVCPLREERNQTSQALPHLAQLPDVLLPFTAARARYFLMKTDLQSCPRKRQIRFIERSENDKESHIHELLLKFYTYISGLSQYFASWMFGIWQGEAVLNNDL
jgi:ABC-type multidrug transport system fused ATPase/permease subunit